MSTGSPVFSEKRGTYIHRPSKISDDTWVLLNDHLTLFPAYTSHYSSHTTVKYFQNPSLNVKTLYHSFQVWYKKKKDGQPLKMNYSTYHRYFTTKTSHAKCDYCTECELKLQVNPNDACKVKYQLHQRRKIQYQRIKGMLLQNIPENTLALEFDYAQNFALPKLLVTKQFYKRLLWLYTFNIHLHSDNNITLYSLFEYECRKDANSVCSYLFHFLHRKREENANLQNVFLLSDTCGGQNKNQFVMKFLCYLSSTWKINIEQLFPVRSHSFSQCDRNFGMYGSLIKKKNITDFKEYLDAFLKCCRSHPFNVLMNSSLILDWKESVAHSNCFHPVPQSPIQKFKIQSYMRLKYLPNGVVLCSKTYRELYTPFNVLKLKHPLLISTKITQPEISRKKAQDLNSLLLYIPHKDRLWYKNIIEKYI